MDDHQQPSIDPIEAAMPQWSDAWILMALVYGNGDASETIGFADAVNHAIPTYMEWAHACAILAPRGLIEAGDPLPIPTSRGTAFIQSFRAAHSSFEAIVSRLAKIPLECFDPVVPPTPTVLQKGWEIYNRRFWRTYNDR